MTIKITDNFLERLRNKAKGLEDDAGYGGRHDDGGARHLRELICAYTSGRDGKIPAFWVEDLNDFVKTQDAEYETYQRLKVKFEGK